MGTGPLAPPGDQKPLVRGQVDELMPETRAKIPMPAQAACGYLSLLSCGGTTDCPIPPGFRMRVKHILPLETGTNFYW